MQRFLSVSTKETYTINKLRQPLGISHLPSPAVCLHSPVAKLSLNVPQRESLPTCLNCFAVVPKPRMCVHWRVCREDGGGEVWGGASVCVKERETERNKEREGGGRERREQGRE